MKFFILSKLKIRDECLNMNLIIFIFFLINIRIKNCCIYQDLINSLFFFNRKIKKGINFFSNKYVIVFCYTTKQVTKIKVSLNIPHTQFSFFYFLKILNIVIREVWSLSEISVMCSFVTIFFMIFIFRYVFTQILIGKN